MRRIMRLTESDLHRIVRMSVKRALRESFETDRDLIGYGPSYDDEYNEEPKGDWSVSAGDESANNFIGALDCVKYARRNVLGNYNGRILILLKNEPIYEVVEQGVKDLEKGKFYTWRQWDTFC